MVYQRTLQKWARVQFLFYLFHTERERERKKERGGKNRNRPKNTTKMGRSGVFSLCFPHREKREKKERVKGKMIVDQNAPQKWARVQFLFNLFHKERKRERRKKLDQRTPQKWARAQFLFHLFHLESITVHQSPSVGAWSWPEEQQSEK